jgi:hypothetical protein
MFGDKSRYKNTETYQVTDSRGRLVTVVGVPVAPSLTFLGYHRLLQGQRLDHLAYKYLADGAGYWKIAEMNHVMLAESLTEKSEIAIPSKDY